MRSRFSIRRVHVSSPDCVNWERSSVIAPRPVATRSFPPVPYSCLIRLFYLAYTTTEPCSKGLPNEQAPARGSAASDDDSARVGLRPAAYALGGVPQNLSQ